MEDRKEKDENEESTVNNFGDSGAAMISESLKTNTSLTILDLGCD